MHTGLSHGHIYRIGFMLRTTVTVKIIPLMTKQIYVAMLYSKSISPTALLFISIILDGATNIAI